MIPSAAVLGLEGWLQLLGDLVWSQRGGGGAGNGYRECPGTGQQPHTIPADLLVLLRLLPALGKRDFGGDSDPSAGKEGKDAVLGRIEQNSVGKEG